VIICVLVQLIVTFGTWMTAESLQQLPPTAGHSPLSRVCDQCLTMTDGPASLSTPPTSRKKKCKHTGKKEKKDPQLLTEVGVFSLFRREVETVAQSDT